MAVRIWPSTGQWFVLDWLTGAALPAVPWGTTGDTPLPADYDGDGIADVTVFRPSSAMWFIRLSSGGTIVIQWGLPSDIPLGPGG